MNDNVLALNVLFLTQKSYQMLSLFRCNVTLLLGVNFNGTTQYESYHSETTRKLDHNSKPVKN